MHFCPQDFLPPSILFRTTFTQIEMSWDDAKTNCEENKLVLVKIPDETTNKIIRDLLPNGTEAWIGLRKPRLWYSAFGYLSQPKWREGQPDNLYGNEFCAAMVLEDGTWTDEPCDKLYPFLCFDGLNNKHFSHI
uniref:C-type lectin domain-containing protein n=1 Tax=Kryptolebias marmoratus TaxID=37003 RepID=A0A3Q3BBN7_KRYMA